MKNLRLLYILFCSFIALPIPVYADIEPGSYTVHNDTGMDVELGIELNPNTIWEITNLTEFHDSLANGNQKKLPYDEKFCYKVISVRVNNQEYSQALSLQEGVVVKLSGIIREENKVLTIPKKTVLRYDCMPASIFSYLECPIL